MKRSSAENKSDAVKRVPTGAGVIARGRDDFHIVPDQFPSVVAGNGNKWDAVERVPTGVGVAARGRDDFHIVPFVPFWRAMGRNGGLGEAKGWKEEMSGTGWNPSLPRDGNRNKSDGVEAVPTR